ncbi:glycosyltransferase [Rhodobacterales bacterium HKCCSP123]|nr:glycosyltransferase [Rhodobacterales bacterium HKCCSP123]
MHVLISVNAAWNVWNFRTPLVEALIADGHSVTVLAPRDDTAPKLEAMGCRIRPLDMSVKGMNPVRDAMLVGRLWREFRALRPDIVLSFTIKNNLYGALAAKAARTPFVPNVTGLGTAFLSGGGLERVAVRLYRGAFRGLPIVFFQNEDDRALFVGRGLVSDAQARLLPGSGIDLERFSAVPYPAAETGPVFLMIARLLRDKGVIEYVEAARRVRKLYPEAQFRLLGEADAANRSAISLQTVRAWEQEKVIEYLGTTDDVRPVIAKAHCVVLPSYREGAPRTLIEAAAMARPLVATDVPGCRSVVADGETGLLCAARSAESLAEACLRILALGPEERAAMGMAGRRKMEREYDQAIVVKAYRDAMAGLVGRGVGPGMVGSEAG